MNLDFSFCLVICSGAAFAHCHKTIIIRPNHANNRVHTTSPMSVALASGPVKTMLWI